MFATRMELIKLSALVTVSKARRSFRTVLVFAGQDPSALTDVEDFDLTVDHSLFVPQQNSSSPTLAQVVEGVERLVGLTASDVLLLAPSRLGSAAAAILGVNSRCTIVHVNAAMTGWDEKLLRLERAATSSSWYFATSDEEHELLVGAGAAPTRVVTAGSTILDAIRRSVPSVRRSKFSMASVFKGKKVVLLHIQRHARAVGPALSQLECEDCFFVLMKEAGYDEEQEETISRMCEAPDTTLYLNHKPFSDILSISRRSHVIIVDNEEYVEVYSLLGRQTILLSEAHESNPSRQGSVLVRPSNTTALLLAVRAALENNSKGDVLDRLVPARQGAAIEVIYQTIVRQVPPSRSVHRHQLEPTGSYHLDPPLYSHPFSALSTAAGLLLDFLSKENVETLVDYECRMDSSQRQRSVKTPCVGHRILQQQGEKQRVEFRFWPSRSEDLDTVQNSLVFLPSVGESRQNLQDLGLRRLLNSTKGRLLLLTCSPSVLDSNGAVDGSRLLEQLPQEFVHAGSHELDDHLHRCSLFELQRQKALEGRREFCWRFGDDLSFSSSLIAMLHAFWLSVNAGRTLVMPSSANHKEFSSRLQDLFSLDSSSIEVLSDHAFQQVCGDPEILTVLDLLADLGGRAVTVDPADALDTREPPVAAMTRLYRSLKFSARALLEAEVFIAQQLGSPFIAVHMTKRTTDECVEEAGGWKEPTQPSSSARAATCAHSLPASIRKAEQQLGREGAEIFVSTGDEHEALGSLGAYRERMKFYDSVCEGFECVLADMLVCAKSDVFIANRLSPFALNVARWRGTSDGPRAVRFSDDDGILVPLWEGYPDPTPHEDEAAQV